MISISTSSLTSTISFTNSSVHSFHYFNRSAPVNTFALSSSKPTTLKMQFTTITLLLATASGALAATCNAVAATVISGTVCPITQAGAAWYEKQADCGSAATVTFEDARGGSDPVLASLAIENTSSGTTRVSWVEKSYSGEDYFYADVAAGSSCDRTLRTGFNVDSVTYA